MSIVSTPFAQDTTVSNANTFTSVQDVTLPSDQTIYLDAYVIGPDCSYRCQAVFRNGSQIGTSNILSYTPLNILTYAARFTISSNTASIQITTPNPGNYSVFGTSYSY